MSFRWPCVNVKHAFTAPWRVVSASTSNRPPHEPRIIDGARVSPQGTDKEDWFQVEKELEKFVRGSRESRRNSKAAFPFLRNSQLIRKNMRLVQERQTGPSSEAVEWPFTLRRTPIYNLGQSLTPMRRRQRFSRPRGSQKEAPARNPQNSSCDLGLLDCKPQNPRVPWRNR